MEYILYGIGALVSLFIIFRFIVITLIHGAIKRGEW